MSERNGLPLTRAVQYGRTRIEYALRYARRATLAIDVHPDLSVVVTAPEGSLDSAVEEKVRKRARWIIEQWRFFETFLPSLPPRKYVSGESHRYLGRQYRLRVKAAEQDGVKLSRGMLAVGLTDPTRRERVRGLVTEWFRQRAEAVFGRVFADCSLLVERHGIRADGFQVRRMSRRWGSCTAGGQILLNPELVAAPATCIEYVVVHEMCHLKHHHHGPAFYRLLRTLMPDWEQRRERLNRCAVG